VRISSFIYFKKILNEIATSHKTLLAMTERVTEIATSFNQKTVDLLAMTERVTEIATSHKTLLAMTEREKIQIPLTPFSKGGN
jgi:hypothetical protein